MTQKSVLVTGPAHGIGRATALALARRGYAVAVVDVNERAGRGVGLPFFRCDVSREAAVRRCVRAVLRRFGRLDALVNNAAIADPASGPVEKLPLAEWNRRIGVNLTGVFLMTKHCAPQLRAARGAIVNIASTRALQSEAHTEAYAAAKGGVVALTHAPRHEPRAAGARELHQSRLDRAQGETPEQGGPRAGFGHFSCVCDLSK